MVDLTTSYLTCLVAIKTYQGEEGFPLILPKPLQLPEFLFGLEKAVKYHNRNGTERYTKSWMIV